MNHEELAAEARKLGRWQQHRFMLLVGLAIVVALLLVFVSMALYNSSGAAQLDLSRPGYVSVRQQVDRSDSFESFPATGPIDQQALEQFHRLYTTQAQQAIDIDSFGGNVMSDQALSLDEPAQQ